MTPMGRAWVRKAEEDRRGVMRLRTGRRAIHSLICFHCQQMAEKYLKALVHERGLAVPRTHDFRKLLAVLGPTDPELARFGRAAFGLSRYAVGPRYPDLFSTPGASQSRSAFAAAARIRAEVRRRLGLRPRP